MYRYEGKQSLAIYYLHLVCVHFFYGFKKSLLECFLCVWKKIVEFPLCQCPIYSSDIFRLKSMTKLKTLFEISYSLSRTRIFRVCVYTKTFVSVSIILVREFV